MWVDVKKKAVDERLAEMDRIFFNVELIFLLVEEKVIKVNGYFPHWNKLLLMWMKIFRQ